MARFAVWLPLLTLFVGTLPSQTTPVSDPQALSLAAKSMAAMTGGAVVTDISFSGTVTLVAGSNIETGTGVFLAKGINESRVGLTLSGGKRTEIRNAASGIPTGSWSGKAGTATIAQHNCWTDSPWFAPMLSSLSTSNAVVVLSYLGRDVYAGIPVLHLRSYRYLPTQDAASAAFLQEASTMDFYLDPSSLLPFAVAFNVHPDNDFNTNIRIEIRFADYRAVNGIKAPFHIQRLLNGGLAMDVAVTNVAVNSGLPDTTFTF
jgi:hypothetical protein